MQIEDSDGEEEDSGMDRENIANQLFDGEDVSEFLYECSIGLFCVFT